MCVNIYDSYKSQLAMANEQFEPQTVEIQVACVCVWHELVACLIS